MTEQIDNLTYIPTCSIFNEANKYPYTAKVSRLTNVHTTIKRDLTKLTKQFFVKGKYEYYHYGQDKFNDNVNNILK